MFKGLSFEVRPGEVLWLRGANGRGKTSLLRLLAGLSTPAHGALEWQGQALRAAGAGYHRAMLYIAHANALKDDLTVTESLEFMSRLHGRESSAEERQAALQRLGLASRRDAAVRTLSQGQRRRVALARLVLERAATLWLLDEPYDALDAEGVACLDDLLGEHAGRGGAAVLTSHLPLGLIQPQPRELALGGFETVA